MSACLRAQPDACLSAITAVFADPSFSGTAALTRVPSLVDIAQRALSRFGAHVDEGGHETGYLADFMMDYIEVVHGRASPECLARFLSE